jgi:transcriptional regulator with XRE-family HTH domain
MIRTEADYQAAKTEAAARRQRLRAYGEKLLTEGYTSEEIEILMQPTEAFAIELEHEIAQYERIRSGDVNEIARLGELGKILIALRISKKITQRDLATRTGVAESQVSRDERHEYHGAKIDRIARVLSVLGAEYKLEVTADGARIQAYVYDELPLAEALGALLQSNGNIGLPGWKHEVRVSNKPQQDVTGGQADVHFETANDNLGLVA